MASPLDLEISELHPRRPPSTYSSQAIPRIQLMVSEPSMLHQSEQHYSRLDKNTNSSEFASRNPLQDMTVGKSLGNTMPYIDMVKPGITGHPIAYDSKSTVNMERKCEKENQFKGNAQLYRENRDIIKQRNGRDDHDLSLSLSSSKFFLHNPSKQEVRENESLTISNSNFHNKQLRANYLKNMNQASLSPLPEKIPEPIMERLECQNQEISDLRGQVQQLMTIINAGNSNVEGLNQSKVTGSLNKECNCVKSLDKTENMTDSHTKHVAVDKKHASTQTSQCFKEMVYKYTPRNDISIPSNQPDLYISKEQNGDDRRCSFSSESFDVVGVEATGIIVNDLEQAPPAAALRVSDAYSCSGIDEKVKSKADPPTTLRHSNDFNNCASNKDIKCIDLCPPEDIRNTSDEYHIYSSTKQDHRIRQYALSQKSQQNLNINEPTIIGRMKQLDISFLKPEDIQTNHATSTRGVENNDYSLMWHPKAAEPSIASFAGCTSKESLILNSTALKSLNDEQLTQVAKHTNRANVNKPKSIMTNGPKGLDVNTATEMTLYGLPEKDLTKSTIQYLEKNRLVYEK